MRGHRSGPRTAVRGPAEDLPRTSSARGERKKGPDGEGCFGGCGPGLADAALRGSGAEPRFCQDGRAQILCNCIGTGRALSCSVGSESRRQSCVTFDVDLDRWTDGRARTLRRPASGRALVLAERDRRVRGELREVRNWLRESLTVASCAVWVIGAGLVRTKCRRSGRSGVLAHGLLPSTTGLDHKGLESQSADEV